MISKQLFIDRSVYAKNQHFRLVLSAKFLDIGKRHFKLHWINKRKYEEMAISKHNFLRTLIADNDVTDLNQVMTLQ